MRAGCRGVPPAHLRLGHLRARLVQTIDVRRQHQLLEPLEREIRPRLHPDRVESDLVEIVRKSADADLRPVDGNGMTVVADEEIRRPEVTVHERLRRTLADVEQPLVRVPECEHSIA